MNPIRVYVIEDDDEFEGDYDGLTWDEIRLFIPASIIKPENKNYIVYTYGDGTFEIDDDDLLQYRLILYKGIIDNLMWEDLVKKIFERTDVIRRI